ncbi:hypothetical protein [Runella rosea]|nr:hypothetical protein [Runella rosea]
MATIVNHETTVFEGKSCPHAQGVAIADMGANETRRIAGGLQL